MIDFLKKSSKPTATSLMTNSPQKIMVIKMFKISITY